MKKESSQQPVTKETLRANRSARPSRASVAWFVAISCGLHFLLLFTLPVLFPKVSSEQKKRALQVWMTPKKKSDPDDEDKKDKQVVMLDPSEPDQRPDDASYLAERNQKTDQETKRTATSKGKPSAPVKSNNSANAQPLPAVSDRLNKLPSQTDDLQPKKLASQKPRIKKDRYLKNKDPLGIHPQFDNLAQASDDQVGEHLPDVKDGDRTRLNAWQWRHAPFFNRIKAQISKVWSPRSQIARHDPNGALLGLLDRVTVMNVTIDREGYLKKLRVVTPSGIAYLDAEAKRAFKKAAPFLFPPKELFDQSDEFSFSFAFHLQINRGISFDFEWDA